MSTFDVELSVNSSLLRESPPPTLMTHPEEIQSFGESVFDYISTVVTDATTKISYPTQITTADVISTSMFPLISTDNISDNIQYNYGDPANSFPKEFELDSYDTLGFGIPNSPNVAKIIHYCMGTLLLLIGICGFSGNGLVLYVFTKYRRLRGGGGPLILSLATGDFLVSLLHGMPAYSSFAESWKFGYRGCELYAAGVGLGGLASLLTLSAIAADRFSVILGRPLTWLAGKKTCCVIWFFCFLMVFPPFVGWSRYTIEGVGTSCSWDYTTRTLNNRLYYIFLLFFGFCVPIFVISVSYIGILRVVCKQSYQMNGISRNGVVNKRTPTKSDLKTAQVILTIIFFFLASWTPYAVVSFIGQFGDASMLSPLVTAMPAIFAKASVIYNPIVYSLSHPHFRSAVRTLLARYWQSTNNPPVGGNDNPGLDQRCRFRPNRKSPCKRQANYGGGEGSGPRKNDGTEGRHHNSPETTGENLLRREIADCEPLRRYGVPGMFFSDSDGCGNGRRPIISDPGTIDTRNVHLADTDSENSKMSADLPTSPNGWAFRRKYSCQESVLTAKSVLPPLVCNSGPGFSDLNSKPDTRGYENNIGKHFEGLLLLEFRKRKRSNIRRSLFHSENCLEFILQKHYMKKRKKLHSPTSKICSEACLCTEKNNNNDISSSEENFEVVNTIVSVEAVCSNSVSKENDKANLQKDLVTAKPYSSTNPRRSSLTTRIEKIKLPLRKHCKVQKMIPLRRGYLACFSNDFFVERIYTAIAHTHTTPVPKKLQSDYIQGNEKCSESDIFSNSTYNTSTEMSKESINSTAIAPLALTERLSAKDKNAIHIEINPWENIENCAHGDASEFIRDQLEMKKSLSKYCDIESYSEEYSNYIESSLHHEMVVLKKHPRNFLKWHHKGGCDHELIYNKGDYYSSVN